MPAHIDSNNLFLYGKIHIMGEKVGGAWRKGRKGT